MLIRLLVQWLPANMPRNEGIGMHWPALIMSAVVSFLVVVLATLLPARLASHVQISRTMQEGSRTVTAGGGIKDTLVAAQIAIALVLVFGGGLLARSLAALVQVQLGFSTDNVLTMHLAAARASGLSDTQSDAQVANFYERAVERVKTIRGVEA